MHDHAENVAVVQIISYQATCPVCGYRSGTYSTPDFARLAIGNHAEASHSDGTDDPDHPLHTCPTDDHADCLALQNNDGTPLDVNTSTSTLVGWVFDRKTEKGLK